MSEHYAKEAYRLLHDDTLLMAFAAVQRSAMQALITVDADDKTAILRLQQKAEVIDEVLSELEAAIHRMARPEDQPVP